MALCKADKNGHNILGIYWRRNHLQFVFAAFIISKKKMRGGDRYDVRCKSKNESVWDSCFLF